MGEASRKKAAREKWVTTLDDDERKVAETAFALYRILPPAACYRASLFLQYHLKKCYGLNGMAVVGFVNDGTDDLYSSHAWYMFRDKMTDIALCQPMDPSIQNPGPLIIQGATIAAGWPTWAYHADRPPEAIAVLEKLRSSPHAERVIEMEELHLRMKATAKNENLIRSYLDGAPDGLHYEALSQKLQDALNR